MVRSSGKRAMAPSAKIAGLAIFVVFAVLAYTALWFYLAGQLQNRVEGLIAGLRDDNVTAACDNLDVRGYPFRIGLACDGVQAATAGGTPASLSTASFRSAAQVYKPGHIVSELDGPLRVALAGGEAVDANWGSLQASTIFGTSGLDRASLDGRDIAAEFSIHNVSDMRLAADNLQVHTRRNGDDLDLAFMSNRTRIEGGGLPANVPELDLVGEARVAGGSGFLGGRSLSAAELRGTSGELTNATAALAGGAQLRLSGPYEIAEDGLISGTFDLAIDNLPVWQATLADIVPQARSTIETAGGILRSLGGGQDGLSVQLQVREGRVALGIIPIGRIPPI
jgi:hypothetical protein